MEIATTFRDDECPTMNKTPDEIDTVIVKIMNEKETRQGKYFEVLYWTFNWKSRLYWDYFIQMPPKPFLCKLITDRMITVNLQQERGKIKQVHTSYH